MMSNNFEKLSGYSLSDWEAKEPEPAHKHEVIIEKNIGSVVGERRAKLADYW